MKASLFWFVLLTAGSACATKITQPLSPVPLSFEKLDSGSFAAHALNASIEIDGAGTVFRGARSSIRMRLRNARRSSLVGQGSAGILNRFIGRDASGWRTQIPLCQKVLAKRVYPGIDLVYYGKDGRLEYDFGLSPYADPAQISLVIEGGKGLRLSSSGDLLIDSVEGTLVQQRPVAYQVIGGLRKTVSSSFVLTGVNRVSFSLGPYDASRSLTIDPVLTYSTYLGGTGLDEGHALAIDAQGSLYVTGRTFSTQNNTSNVLLFKITSSGSIVQSIFGGKLGNDTGNAVSVDSSGNVYVAGATSSADFPVASNNGYVLQSGLLGSMNAFLLALPAANTTLIFSTFFGGSYSDEALGMVTGPNNYLYVVGDTTSPNLATITADVFQLANHGSYDGFLACFTTSGTLVFGTYIGGSGDDHATAVAVDSSGYSYVVGSTSSTDFPVNPGGGYINSFQNTNHGNTDAFAIRLFPDGTLAQWSTYIGGSSTDAASAVSLDSSGNVYVAGTTASEDFPTLAGAYQTTYQGGVSDGFVLVLHNNGQGFWGSFFGSAGGDAINGMALDGSADIILTGTTDNANFPVTADAAQSAIGGGQDAILSILAGGGGSLLFSTYLGGTGNEIGLAVLSGSSGQIYLTGSTTSSNNDFPVTSGARQTTYGGGTSDAFISIFGCPSAVPVVTAAGVVNAGSYSPSAISPGAAVSIFGTNLGCTPAGATSIPLPVSLSSVSVQINGTAIPLYYVSGTQINAQIPYETATGSASLTVTGPGGTSAAITIPVVVAAPGIFSSSGQAAAFNQDFTVNSSSNPAKTGSVVTVFFTGPGPLSQSVTTGAAIPNPPPYVTATLANSATIGGLDAPVYFMGMSPGLVGLAQANLTVPNLAAGTYPVVITIGGVSSQSATLAVTP